MGASHCSNHTWNNVGYDPPCVSVARQHQGLPTSWWMWVTTSTGEDTWQKDSSSDQFGWDLNGVDLGPTHVTCWGKWLNHWTMKIWEFLQCKTDPNPFSTDHHWSDHPIRDRSSRPWDSGVRCLQVVRVYIYIHTYVCVMVKHVKHVYDISMCVFICLFIYIYISKLFLKLHKYYIYTCSLHICTLYTYVYIGASEIEVWWTRGVGNPMVPICGKQQKAMTNGKRWQFMQNLWF